MPWTKKRGIHWCLATGQVLPKPIPTLACNGELGHAIIEFASVLPFLFFLFFGAFDVARAIHLHNKVSIISREAASSAFRNCLITELPQPVPLRPGMLKQPEELEFLQLCLDRTADTVKRFGRLAEDSFRFNISVFNCNNFQCRDRCRGAQAQGEVGGECFICECLGDVSGVASPDGNLDVSKYWVSGQPHTAELNQILDRRGVAVIAEVSAPSSPFFTVLFPNSRYEQTIY